MRVVDEPMETLHLYVVPENQLPPNGDHLAIFMMIFCSLFLIGIIVLSVLVPAPDHNVEFPLAIEGYSLPPVTKTVKITTIATGKQYVLSTTATGMITFYNGAIYTQIIPINTILKGADGVPVITDAQATIPPAEQTIPPTYGQTSVPAHAVAPGRWFLIPDLLVVICPAFPKNRHIERNLALIVAVLVLGITELSPKVLHDSLLALPRLSVCLPLGRS